MKGETAQTVDVCLVVEGCYPYITGGVSSWLDWLIRVQPDLTFGVVALVADEAPRKVMFDLPENVMYLQVLPLDQSNEKVAGNTLPIDKAQFSDDLCKFLRDGELSAFASLAHTVSTSHIRQNFFFGKRQARLTRSELMNSFTSWEVMVECYERLSPNASFVDFFWAWRNLVGGLFSVLCADVPPAKVYHSISTGYAGLFAAAASIATSRPSLITEHGIYTNERRIDLVMAEWIPDVIGRGYYGIDSRTDVRDFWIDTFSAFARVAYAAATKITTLYGENQTFQRALGATEEKLAVIPNGIALEKFATLNRTPASRPTVGLIGRVVPIKDIEGCILAAAQVRREIPNVEFLILGPIDEDPAYFEMCKQKVADLSLENSVRFVGKVNILDYLPRIDVLILTSISEAQPLVLLEGGAAGIPCVATDVGSCREIVEGPKNEDPALGAGGRVVPPMNSDALAEAICELLSDDDLRKLCGERLRKRVETYFTSQVSSGGYASLYAEAFAA